jgi:RimJ/RimL family protein N-acetyltransferase
MKKSLGGGTYARFCRPEPQCQTVGTHPTISLVPALPALTEPLTDGVVSLRRFTLDDVAAVTRACQDPEIPRWTAGIPEPYEEHHARGWIMRHDAFWSKEGRAAFAFCDARNGELLGSMALGEVDFTARSAVAGYWAAPWARHRGATTRALALACRWGFDVLGLRVVNLMTLLGNIASERVAQRAGFVLVGMVQDYAPPRALDPEARHEVKHWVLRANRAGEESGRSKGPGR